MIEACVVTCPHCNFSAREEMPPCAPQTEYVCGGCRRTLTVSKGECCIFCAYGSMFCPPVQDRRNHCCAD